MIINLEQLKEDLKKNWTLIVLDRYYNHEELRDLAVRNNPNSIISFKEEHFNSDWIDLLIDFDYTFLQYIPKKYHTLELCLKVIKKFSLWKVYPHFKQKHKIISKAYFKLYPSMIENIPKEHHTVDMMIYFLKNNNPHMAKQVIGIKNKKFLNYIYLDSWSPFSFNPFYSQYKNLFSNRDLIKLISKNPSIAECVDYNLELAFKVLEINKNHYSSLGNFVPDNTSYEVTISFLNEKKKILSLIGS